MNSHQISKLAMNPKRIKISKKVKRNIKSKLARASPTEKSTKFFFKNKQKFKLPNKIKHSHKNKKIQRMRFQAFKTFDKTCVNIFRVKDTLRQHHQKMLPLIMKNLKNSEYLVVEEAPEK